MLSQFCKNLRHKWGRGEFNWYKRQRTGKSNCSIIIHLRIERSVFGGQWGFKSIIKRRWCEFEHLPAVASNTAEIWSSQYECFRWSALSRRYLLYDASGTRHLFGSNVSIWGFSFKIKRKASCCSYFAFCETCVRIWGVVSATCSWFPIWIKTLSADYLIKINK